MVSYPDYPKEEIEEVFTLASEVRDHMVLVKPYVKESSPVSLLMEKVCCPRQRGLVVNFLNYGKQ